MNGQSANTVWSITEVNEYIRLVLESQTPLNNIWLRGEISNFKNHYKTGHYYFTVKDEMSALRAVMFRGANASLTFVPQDGMKVLLRGKIVSYPRDGQTQIVVAEMVPDGAGSLAIAFEQLRRRLEAEGLFAAERKRPLPRYPKSIGIVTSPTGAAIHDMIRVAGRRYPAARLILYPALVQGEGAPLSLRTGVDFFNSVEDLVDVIILGRGGGSMEDLWAFNDEALARCVAASRIPVISAVGHESDVTICDFVADYRASTPSAAAEAAVPDRTDLLQMLSHYASALQRRVDGELRAREDALRVRAENRMLRAPEELFDLRRLHLCHREERVQSLLKAGLESSRAALARTAAALDGRNPLSILTRGYAMVTDAQGATRTKAASFTAGEQAVLCFADGTVKTTVDATILK
ncbi:MAG: exodeoxyribonuclease VII large subunit [Clostridia bacterium]|nr:exodeoxyribonuclease VII large subunit [Clostridia bacterium]